MGYFPPTNQGVFVNVLYTTFFKTNNQTLCRSRMWVSSRVVENCFNSGCKNRLHRSQKAHSDVKHLLSACFAVRVFYGRARKYWITYLTYFHHYYHGMKNCVTFGGRVENHILKIGSVLHARVILIARYGV